MLRKLPILLLAGVMLSGCQQRSLHAGAYTITNIENGGSQVSSMRTVTVLSHTQARIGVSRPTLQMDCSSLQDHIVRTVKEPEHGKLIIRTAQEFTEYPASSPLSKCNEKRTPVTVVEYKSDPGYVGADTVIMESFNATRGFHGVATFNIQVQP